MVTAQAIILGVLTAGYALMLCYVWADARHLKLSAPVWFAITFLFNVVGFIAYLIYSAIKTDNWKRATLPIAYICEGILVGLFVLVPLIYRGSAVGSIDDLFGSASASPATSTPACCCTRAENHP